MKIFPLLTTCFICLSCHDQASAQYQTVVINDPGATNIINVPANNAIELLGGRRGGQYPLDLALQGSPVAPGGVGYDDFSWVGISFPNPTNSALYQDPMWINCTLRTWNGNSFYTSTSPVGPTIVAGPCRIVIFNKFGGVFFTYRLINQSGAYIPSNATLIPSDAAGPVNIVLESSTNLVDWVGANPGSYGASGHNRFFRVRALKP